MRNRVDSEDIRARGAALVDAGPLITTTGIPDLLAEVTGAMPGSRSARAACQAAEVWQLAVANLGAEVVAGAHRLMIAGESYARVEERLERRFGVAQ